ncbi:DUF1120 domain-containing protein [Citrobacter arsenatis]|uniref:DUF1120 domain-containing protein n=1 Tax=Citrobacter arsenatis TaxID=2546350 RepID=UPI00300E6822
MKKTLLAVMLAACATTAFAEPTAVLKVKGVLTNSACTPELSNSGVVDYGTIHLSELSDSAVNQLGQKTIDLTITCDAETKVSWNLVDDRVDSRAGVTVANGSATNGSISDANQTYGVGKTADDVAIGNYSLFVKVSNVVADGKSADTIYMLGNNNVWSATADGITEGQNNRDITVAASGSLEPVGFTTATFPLVTSLAIQDTKTLAITDDTDLNGQVTISLRYL